MSRKSTARLIDDLGALLAQKAEIDKEVKATQARLIEALGVGNAGEGETFRATVFEVRRNLLDMDAVRAKLSQQFINANTRSVVSTSVKVCARNNDVQ